MNDSERTGVYQPGDKEETAVAAAAEPIPQRIGRYRVEKILGKGGFGLVYLAHDDQLQRPVALKLLRPGRAEDRADGAEICRGEKGRAWLPPFRP